MDIRYCQSIKGIFKLTVLISVLVSCSSGGSGSGSKLSIGGVASGLLGNIALQNNGNETITVVRDGRYAFATRLDDGAAYNVVILTQPSAQICTLENASGTVVKGDVTDIQLDCESDSGLSISGSYQVAPLIQVDSDINDVTAVANVDNGDSPIAQTIPNFSTINGFATESGTGRISAGDRFADGADTLDVYRVNLQKDQTLRLQVVDFDGVDTFTGDLDLFLFDQALNIVGSSETVDEFEDITVATDGDYFIAVFAFSGTSKYTLSLNGVTSAGVLAQNSMDFMPGEAIIQFKPNAKVNNFKASHQQMALSHSETTRATLANFDTGSVSSAALSSSLKKQPGFMATLKQKNSASYQKFQTLQEIKRLNQRQDIEYAEPNYIYKPLQVPNDEFYNLQWHYPAINLPQAWDITTGTITTGPRVGSDVIVAVADTGVFLAHPELAGQLVDGYDFISDSASAADGDGIDDNPDDLGDSAQLNNSSWHGTHVAGTVAAETDNNNGVAGVAWQAKIMPLRVLGRDGGTDFDIIQAILFAARLPNNSGTIPAQKADIINLSLGGGGSSQAAQNAYNAARAEGVIVIAAAGNANNSQLSFPASYDGVISVSATDFANNRAPYSSFGSKIDVAAPGGSQGVDLNNDGFGDGVLSTLVDDSSGSRLPVLNYYQGTSMAAPHMAGVVALMRAVYPALTPDELDIMLVAGAITTDLGDSGRDDTYGHGLLDALKAVQEAQKRANGGTLPTQPALIVATPNQLTLGAISSSILTLSNLSPTDASIASVVDNASWLTVVADTVDANNLGTYQVSIDRTGLADSSYLGTITFNLSTGSSLTVQVSMNVGNIETAGNAGTVYMLLVDVDDNFVDQASPVDTGNGVFTYSFDNVPVGSYRIVGGSDIDNDSLICQLAEVCGGYPTINELSTVEVTDSSIENLDFIVDILANFGASSLFSDKKVASGFQRRVDKTSKTQLPDKQLAQ